MQDGNDGFNFYDGEFQPAKSDSKFQNINPSTERSIGEFPITSSDEVRHVCESAKKAFKEWKQVSRFKRGEYLLRVAEIIEKRG